MVLFQIFGQLDFNQTVRSFENMGVFDVLLPFFLIFAVIFAILEKTKIFGEKRKNINVVVSVIIGFLVVSATDIVNMINQFLPRVSLIIIVALAFMLVIGLLGGAGEWSGFPFTIAILVAIGAIIWALWASLLPTGATLRFFGYNLVITQQDKAILLTLLVFLIVIWYVTRSDEGGGGGGGLKTGWNNFVEALNKGFKGKD